MLQYVPISLDVLHKTCRLYTHKELYRFSYGIHNIMCHRKHSYQVDLDPLEQTPISGTIPESVVMESAIIL